MEDIPLALAYDDVLLVPGASSVQPAGVSLATRLTREIRLAIPIVNAAASASSTRASRSPSRSRASCG
jgi:IMP dehydrogenase